MDWYIVHTMHEQLLKTALTTTSKTNKKGFKIVFINFQKEKFISKKVFSISETQNHNCALCSRHFLMEM